MWKVGALLAGSTAVGAGALDAFLGVDIAGKIAEYGILGLFNLLLLVGFIRKDRQVTALQNRLAEKAENDAAKYHELAREMDLTLKELTDTLEIDLSAEEPDEDSDDPEEKT